MECRLLRSLGLSVISTNLKGVSVIFPKEKERDGLCFYEGGKEFSLTCSLKKLTKLL